jgi:outer membrane protein
MCKSLQIRLYLLFLLIFTTISSNVLANDSDRDVVILSDTLSLENAIRIGLERNYGILIARNLSEIASLNKNRGSAGFFPSLDVTGGFNGGREDVIITEDGIEEPSVRTISSAVNADAALSWTVFDGMKMFATYNKLSQLEELGSVRARIEIENTVQDIVTAYYNIVRIAKQLTVLQNTVEISEERYRIADTKRQLGSGSEYELLLARTDLNSDRAAVIREEVALSDARLRLIRILDLDINANVKVDPEIRLMESLIPERIYEGILERNSTLEAVQIQSRIARLERQELVRGRLPSVELNAGYNINNRETENTIRRLQESEGIRYGVTVRVPIFDGFNLNRQLQAARIYEKNATLNEAEQLKFLQTIAVAEVKNYENTRKVVDIERENLELANQTLEIALERFYLGTITSLELRESQRTLINTETRLITAQFEAKISETELLRLMGQLPLIDE